MQENNKQFIVAISREYGSGGHEIAEVIAKRLGVSLYDSNLLEIIADEHDVDHEQLRIYDEVPRVKLFSRKVKGHSNSMEEHVANMQFDFLKRQAEKGESFVVVGRCAEEVLKEYKNKLITIFILGSHDAKVKRISKIFDLSEEDAEEKIERENFRRKMYHNYYCKGKWGDSRNYEFSINDSVLGIEKTTDIIENYIKIRIEEM